VLASLSTIKCKVSLILTAFNYILTTSPSYERQP